MTQPTNKQKIESCKRHRWAGPIPEDIYSPDALCLNCGGLMPVSFASLYTLGYIAAGGNPLELWPEHENINSLRTIR